MCVGSRKGGRNITTSLHANSVPESDSSWTSVYNIGFVSATVDKLDEHFECINLYAENLLTMRTTLMHVRNHTCIHINVGRRIGYVDKVHTCPRGTW